MSALLSSLPALVEALPSQPAASPESLFTRERQVAFLHALAATGAVRAAAGRAGVSHQTAYRVRLADALFRRGWCPRTWCSWGLRWSP